MPSFAHLFFLAFIVGIPCYAAWKSLPVFDVFIEGAKAGVSTTLNLVPYLVGMIVAIGMLRASGFFELIAKSLEPLLTLIGFPSELVPLALVRPFSGSAANGVMAELIHHEGGNSLLSKMAATMMGSTETTFFVIAVYFGSIGIQRTRHAVPTGLIADLAGILASVWICRWMFA
jgi:spore maturation protein B